MQMVFVLGVKMHERYILPALALMLLAYVMTRDVRVLGAALLVTAASAVNIGVVLAFDYLIAPNLWLGYVIGTAQVIAMGLMFWASVDLVWRGHALTLPAHHEEKAQASEAPVVYAADERMRSELLNAPKKPMQMTKRDWAIMLLLTAAYAVVGFWGLGDTVAQKIVEVRDAGEIFSVDELRRKAGLSKTILEMLRSYGVFRGMQEDDQFSFF